MCLNAQFIHGNLCPCGKCMECKIQKSNEWAFRVCLEASLYEKNCMLTLTYDNEHLPENSSLCKRDVQLFIKRLRKFLYPKKIRYFGCGEYGDRKGRPHYHIIIFDYDPEDKYYFFTDKKGNDLFRSETIEKLWTLGLSTVGEVNFDTAKYCAIYLQKKHLKDGRIDPFTFMSRKPGIGAFAIKDIWLSSDKIYINGKYTKIPRYFLDLFSKNGFENQVLDLKAHRKYRMFQQFADYAEKTFDLETGEFYDFYYANYDCMKKEQDNKRERFKKIFGKDFENF